MRHTKKETEIASCVSMTPDQSDEYNGLEFTIYWVGI